ncbi:MAG TPA: homoserine kinase [Microlunatus sp.]
MVHELDPGQATAVSVPASSANVGPGFDCFGLALDWREYIELEVTETGYAVEVSGEGADLIPRDESHLVLSSVLLGLADLGVQAPGLRLRAHNTLPHGRGLGSSSAAIVAGLLAARGLAGTEPDPRWMLRHANAIEGHPDNVAAAIYGGFVLAYDGGAGVAVARARVLPEITGWLFVAAASVETTAARRLLPDSVPHVDAAANSSRAALLVHALSEEPELLVEATRDWLHQGYRGSAMPRSYDLLLELRGRGLAAVISGAGPSVLVLGVGDELTALADLDVRGFTGRPVRVGGAGRIEPESTPIVSAPTDVTRASD